MEKVPEHIMEEAQDVAFDCDPTKTSDQIANTIAVALLAAEKRGREEAAKICETHRVYEIGDRHMLAAAIRSGQ